jgi:hypothetical protein
VNAVGNHFELIADSLIKPLADDLQAPRCDGCGRETPQYFLFGPPWYVALGLRASLMPAAIAQYDMQRACLDCTKEHYSRSTPERKTMAIQSLRSSGKPDRLWRIRRIILARTLALTPPYFFFAQYPDWPVCCRKCCEFTGYPQDAGALREAVRCSRYWERGPKVESPFGDDIQTEDPSTDVNLFRCSRCGTTYYTHQIT